MTYPTELLTFYWERLGYENQHLPTKCSNVVGGSPSDSPTEYAKACGVEQTMPRKAKSPRDQDSMG
jgi:hypothetical protein